VAADKDDAAAPWIIRQPVTLQITLKDRLNRLENQPPALARHIQNSLDTHNIRAPGRHQILEPVGDQVAVQRVVSGQRFRLYGLIVGMVVD
jgi:hypothetical protein